MKLVQIGANMAELRTDGARCYPQPSAHHPLDAHLDAILRAARDAMCAALQSAIDAERAELAEALDGLVAFIEGHGRGTKAQWLLIAARALAKARGGAQ